MSHESSSECIAQRYHVAFCTHRCTNFVNSLRRSRVTHCFSLLSLMSRIHYLHNPIIHLYYSPRPLHNHCLQFLLGHENVPREVENNAYADSLFFFFFLGGGGGG